jgi:hypothetical protein
MAVLQDRERAFESKYAHDDQLRFRAQVRSVQYVGLWAAKRMGQNPESGAAYAAALVESYLAVPGREKLLLKLQADFQAAQVSISEHRIRRQIDECDLVALQEVSGG